jgi:hypothetical protein
MKLKKAHLEDDILVCKDDFSSHKKEAYICKKISPNTSKYLQISSY